MPDTDPAPGWWHQFVLAQPARTAKVGVVRLDGSPHVAPVWVDSTVMRSCLRLRLTRSRERRSCATPGCPCAGTTNGLLSVSSLSPGWPRLLPTQTTCSPGRPHSRAVHGPRPGRRVRPPKPSPRNGGASQPDPRRRQGQRGRLGRRQTCGGLNGEGLVEAERDQPLDQGARQWLSIPKRRAPVEYE